MMMFEEVEQIVQDHIALIKIDAVGLAQGRERAAKFLVIQAVLSNHLKELNDAKVHVSTLEKSTYAQALMSGSGKNVTENKIMAEADPTYSKVRESTELVDAEINWTKQHFDIFNNAHLMFRQYSRE